jgi:hypothetical protein
MENDSDYEQVFVVSDTDDASGNEHKPFGGSRGTVSPSSGYYEHSEDTKKFLSNAVPVAIVVAVVFVAISFFIILVGNAFNMKPEHMGTLVFLSIIGLILIALFSIKGQVGETAIEDDSVMAEIPSLPIRRGKRKKFNNVQEYRASEEFRRHKAELASRQTDEQRKNQERIKDIDVAVKALVSLGFKIKRATHLVSLALDSGISHKETQMLVKYALSNNNKA